MMATVAHDSQIEQIGSTAGEVWETLAENGPMSMAKLVDTVGQPRATVFLALGWLAREDKVSIDEEGRTRVVSLR